MNLKPFLTCSVVALLLAGCGSSTPPDQGPQRPPGLYAEPARLAYTCVTPGCDTTLNALVTVSGSRRIAIKRVLLDGPAASDFTFTPSEAPPFVVGSNSSFSVDVRYAPTTAPIAGHVRLLITYTDASPEESDDRLPPGELEIPLVRRIVGEPVLTATPEILQFGVVAPNEKKTLPVVVANEGFGNVVLTVKSAEAGDEAFSAELPSVASLGPSTNFQMPVTFAPTLPKYVKTQVLLKTTMSDVVPVPVIVEGTSLTTSRMAIEPGGNIDFGLVKKGAQRVVSSKIMNQGGADLVITNILLQDTSGNLKFELTAGNAGLNIPPLERTPFTVTLTGTTPGPVDAMLTFTTNDPARPSFEVRIFGTVTEPRATLAPQGLNFGTVPVGWVLSQPVEIRNTGFGPLRVKNVTLVSGSSQLFTVVNLPALPLDLPRDGRVAVDVQFKAETQATFNGFLSVESDDPVNPFTEIPLTAKVGSCALACPIANGTPTCAAGTCDVGSCNAGFFNTDGKPSTGCECAEIGTDPGNFCATAADKGTLVDKDNGSSTLTGVLPTKTDEDVIRFFGQDAFEFFNDSYNVKVRLTSADPTIKMCVYKYGTNTRQNECYWSNEVCPTNRYYSDGSNGAGNDSADYLVKIYRDATQPPLCTSYTVFISNG